MGGVHPPAGVEDALDQLDSRFPMLSSERTTIVQGLYDLAFGKGRKAGIQSVRNRIREVAAEAGNPESRELLLAISDSYDDPRAEYQDPTRAIRDRLADRARMRTSANFTAPYPER